MFTPCINSIKTLVVVLTDAHNDKIIGMLKQLKFRQLLRHVSVHAGTIIRDICRHNIDYVNNDGTIEP